MQNTYLLFLENPSHANYMKAINHVMNHKDYNPYSDDLDILTGFLDDQKYDEAIAHMNVNLLLSPRAHFFKRYAHQQKKNKEAAQSETFFADRILFCIQQSGDGTKASPYIISRISDERDFLDYLKEDFAKQALVKGDDEKVYDVISTQSGKDLYFDITKCYSMISQQFTDFGGEEKKENEQKQENKKWWKFW